MKQNETVKSDGPAETSLEEQAAKHAEELKLPIETEVVELEPVSLVITDEFLVQFENQVVNFKKYLGLCLKLTNETDWRLFGKGYYFQASGCEKVSSPLGIIWGTPDIICVNEDGTETKRPKGPSYTFEVEGIIESRRLKRYIWAFGACSSDDKFFLDNPAFDAMRDYPHIKKAAISNWEVNAITRLIGLRNTTRAELQAAGLDVDAIGTTDFRTQEDRQKGSQSEQETRNKLRKIILEMVKGDEDKSRDFLELQTEFEGDKGTVPGIRNIGNLRGKRLFVTYKIVKDLYDDWKREGGDASDRGTNRQSERVEDQDQSLPLE